MLRSLLAAGADPNHPMKDPFALPLMTGTGVAYMTINLHFMVIKFSVNFLLLL